MSGADHLEGGCACGAVRYRITDVPLVVHACHCRSCQRLTGAWHAVNALIETSAVELLQGELRYSELPTPSGAGQTVARCVHCSVALWSNYNVFPGSSDDRVRFVRVGTLDEPQRMPVDVHIFDEFRNLAAPVPSDAPSFPGFYELPEIWSSASLQRLGALFPSP